MTEAGARSGSGPMSARYELRVLGALSLRGLDGRDVAAVLAQPKRLALLSYLAVERPGGFHRRDTLVALFWPERDQARARAALRKALQFLRHELPDGVIVVRGEEEVGVDSRLLEVDAVEFVRAIAAGRFEQSLQAYGGGMLSGLHLSDAPELERWFEETRHRLHDEAVRAASALSSAAQEAADFAGAVAWARRAATLAPFDETRLRALLEALDRIGDRAGALREYESFRRRLADELDVAPAPETTRLVSELRRREVARTHFGPADSIAARPAAARLPSSAPRADAAPPPCGGDLGGRRRARRFAVLGGVGVLAAALLVLLGGRGGSGRAVGPPATHTPIRVLVADLENQARDSLLARAVTQVLRIDIARSRSVQVVGSERLGDALVRMGRARGERVDAALAFDLAPRVGIAAVLTGEIARAGDAIVISVRVTSASTGIQLAASTAVANSEAGVVNAADRLSERLRRELGEPMGSLRAEAPLERVTTPSLEALTRFTQATQAFRDGDMATAIARYEDAIRLDSSFAMAYSRLGTLLRMYGAEHERADAALAKAAALSDRLPDFERHLTRATYFHEVTYELHRAAAAYRAALQVEPDNAEAWISLCAAYWGLRDYERAESAADRAIAADSLAWRAHWRRANLRAIRGRYDLAEAGIRRFAELAPGQPSAGYERARLLYARGEPRAALRLLDSLGRVNAEWRSESNYIGAHIAATHGWLSEALERAERAGVARGLPGDAHIYTVNVAANASWRIELAGDTASAVRAADAALRRHPLSTFAVFGGPYLGYATLYARAGRLDRARATLAMYDRGLTAGTRRRHAPERLMGESYVMLRSGRPDSALRLVRAAERLGWMDVKTCSHGVCLLAGVGEIYEALGQPDSAIAAYERFVDAPHLWRVYWDPYFLAPALERLGELHAVRGDRASAARHLRRLVALWRQCDVVLLPRRRAAERRLAALEREEPRY